MPQGSTSLTHVKNTSLSSVTTGSRCVPSLISHKFPSLSLTASVEKGTRFVEEGVKELLKARRVLCGSYVYGYYLEDNGYNKTIFEYMQVIFISFLNDYM